MTANQTFLQGEFSRCSYSSKGTPLKNACLVGDVGSTRCPARKVIPYLLCNHWKLYSPEQELEHRVESRRMHRTLGRKEKVRTKGDPNQEVWESPGLFHQPDLCQPGHSKTRNCDYQESGCDTHSTSSPRLTKYGAYFQGPYSAEVLCSCLCKNKNSVAITHPDKPITTTPC